MTLGLNRLQLIIRLQMRGVAGQLSYDRSVTHMAPDEVATQSITYILVNFVNSPGLQTLQTNIHLKSVNIKNVSSFEMCK